MKLKPEKMWAIMGQWDRGSPFIYIGTWLTKNHAIAVHTREMGKNWTDCKKDGDRAIKVLVTPI